MRILMVGDLHGDTAALFKVVNHAVDAAADAIVQLGDFGFWPRAEFGRKFLRKAEARLAEVGLDLWWVDGNHEDHKALATRRIESDGRVGCQTRFGTCPADIGGCGATQYGSRLAEPYRWTDIEDQKASGGSRTKR